MNIEARLTAVLSEFARTLITDFPIQAILDHLVVRIVDVLPITGAGVTLISPGIVPRYVAASDATAMRFEQLQTELGDGPCVAAFETGAAVAVPDLRADNRFPAFASRAVAEGLAAVFTFPLRRGNEQLGALDLYRTSIGPLDVAATAAAGTLADVAAAYLQNAQARADLQESSERAYESSLHDSLTGLPNRTLLVQRLEHAILRCRRSEKMVGILFADLDRLKSINDTYGHHIGDELLRAVAARLTRLLRPGDTLARMAGDEFAILCEGLDDASQVEPLAARIDLALTEPFLLSGAEAQVSASVGIAFAGRGDEVPEQVIRDADTAMYQAKRKGGGRHGIIDLREQQLVDEGANLNRDLRGALARGELRLEYQPIVAARQERIAGVEALLRWDHPILGLIPPEKAVALAERSGLISDIGRWVLEQACIDGRGWQPGPNGDGFGISVNVSVHQIMTPNFTSAVAAVLADTETDPATVTLELTESVFIHDSERALVVLKELKRLGVMLALDDFGTGYSSLSYLNRFPVDIVKIDRAFISDLGHEQASGLIVDAVVRLAHGLGMRAVAEGVETVKQYEQILALKCDYYQGFYFSRPMRATELGARILGVHTVRGAPFSTQTECSENRSFDF